MKERRIDFIYKPLLLTATIEPYGTVPPRQVYNAMAYDAETGTFGEEWVPDYTVNSLILYPKINVQDPDGIIAGGNVNSQLTNMTWTEIIDGTRTLITSGSDYVITESGFYKGQLAIRKNFAPGSSATFEFQASFLDTRTNQTLTKILTYIVKCSDETSEQPTLLLDSPEQKLWYPFSDVDEQVITPRLVLAGAEVPRDQRVFVWEELRDGGGWSAVGSDNADSDVSLSTDGEIITVNRRMMGDGISLRCRARYDPTGTSPSSIALNDTSPAAYTTIRRYMPKFDADYVGVPANIPPDTEYLCPSIKVKVTNGEVTNWAQELVARWYMARNNSSSSLTYVQVADDDNPEIPTTLMDVNYGAMLALDVKDRGAMKVWANADGKALVDASGKVILFH